MLLGDEPLDELARDHLAGGEGGAVVDPLPHLRAGDLGGGGVLHEVVDACRAVARQPGVEVLHADPHVAAQPGLGALAGRLADGEQVGGRDRHVVAEHVELVGPAVEDGVEDLLAQRHQVGVGHPRAVEAGAGLARLVLAHLGEGALVDLGVAPARDEGRHPADREGAASVAGPHEEVAVGGHHRRRHGHRVAVGEGEGGSRVAEVLDDAEQVVPAAGVEPGRVVAQLVEDLVHLEGRGDGLDQDGRPHRAVRHPERGLGVGEDVVPQARLEVRLHLRQVVVGPAPGGQQLAGVVEEVQAEVDQGRDHGAAVGGEVGLVEVPAAGAGEDHRRARRVGDGVLLALGRGEGEAAADGVAQGQLAADDVAPVRGVGVLEVGEPHPRAGVEGVDRHLRVGGAGDLDAAVAQVRGHGRHRPVGLAHVGRPGQEVEAAGPGDLLAPAPAGREQLVATLVEAGVEVGHEGERLGGEHLLGPRHGRGGHVEAGHGRHASRPGSPVVQSTSSPTSPFW